MTMEEMARIIGVSRITLSKVINGREGVSPETRERVKEYIEKYNFEPNNHARSLVGKKEPIIGFFTTYSEEGTNTHVTSHLATELVNLIVNAAQKRGYKTLVSITGKEDDFSEVEKYMNSGLIMGAVLFGYATGSGDLECLSKVGIPLVLINQEEETDLPNISLVNMDDETWGYQAIERLVQANHRRLLYINCSRRRLPIQRRTHGVRRALSDYKGQILSFEEFNGEYSEDISYVLTHKRYEKKGEPWPTGIFAGNDQMAIGAINALKDLGIQVPGDVSVIGFDDIAISRYITPALTTVRSDFREIAQRSVTILTDCIEGKSGHVHEELQLEFVMRESLGVHEDEKGGNR